MKPRAYSYIRYSSPQQAKGDSFRRQFAQTQKFCEENAYFGAFRSVISGLSDHPFRFKPITDSAIIRSLLAQLRNR